MSPLPRRALLGGAAALGVAGLTPALPPGAARAAAPRLGGPSPAWYRFPLGTYEVTVVSDGVLPLPATGGFPDVPPERLRTLLTDNFLPTDQMPLQQNVVVVNTGRHLVLIDTGMGASMGKLSRMFGDSTGRLLANLRAAGLRPEDVDAVLLTHAHCDHCWGLVDEAGARVFPNAQVAVSEADLAFWTDEAKLTGDGFTKDFVAGARKNILPYRDRLIMVRDRAEVLPGITALAAPGHTVGHHVYAISSGTETLVNIGDLAHHHVLLLRHPGWRFAYDTDPALSATTRTRMLDMLARDRLALLAYHFPWPGHGHVAKASEGYAFLPAPMRIGEG